MNDVTLGRPKFIDGMLLSAEELSLEQSYFDRRLLQFGVRFGRGVVQGLEVWPAPEEPSAPKGKSDPTRVIVGTGFALDAKGREIVLGKQKGLEVEAADGVVCIRWREPNELDASNLGKLSLTRPNTGPAIRSVPQAELKIFRISEVEQALADEWVPIALIGRRGRAVDIKRILRLSGIAKLSWSRGEHRSSPPTEWWIEFWSPLRSVPPREAFDIRVRAGGTETMAAIRDDPELDLTRTRLSFKVDWNRKRLDSTTVFVRLSCDFFIDLKGDPISSAHPRSEPPSESSIAGGLFESWFSIDGAAR